jgi:hypothetical protein
MLQWWESDPATRLGLLYLESFGNPRKFARTARRVGRRIPLLTVVSGRSEAGLRAAASHTAAAATPDATREALFQQAGIVTGTVSVSSWTPQRCWPANPYRKAHEWRSSPTPVAPACSLRRRRARGRRAVRDDP